MARLLDTFVPSSTYNNLPHISDVAAAPFTHSADLEVLRLLLAEYSVSDIVSVRLIHKHYDTRDGEVMVIDKLSIPEFGLVQTMKPIVPMDNQKLHGIHYFVNEQGLLQAYEYAPYSAPKTLGLQSFLGQFCFVIMERGLQNVFGLKFKDNDVPKNVDWTEFEFSQKRATIMLQKGMPMPTQTPDYSVSTEWGCPEELAQAACSHIISCSGHVPKRRDLGVDKEAGFYLGEQRLLPGSSIHRLVEAIAF